ncbi:MAG: prolipoprotein diacylglyceryl transferase [Nanoarchaeota archaeon]|nr:prolipoprotein diacylglyceryl transferase [Nanoarchaeota archaeon]
MIDPVLLKIGIFEIRWYGLVYVLGFLLVYFLLNKYRNRVGLNEEDVESYVFYLILGTVIGARLFHVFIWDFSYYSNHVLDIFKLWEGGMAFCGGFFGSILTSYIFCKKKKISFLKLGDVVVIPAILALSLGRIANFVNQELWGTVTNFKYCVDFDGECRHPYQIYSAIKRFFIFVVLFSLNLKKRKDGLIFWSFICLTSFGRFFLDFLKDETKYLSLTIAQYFSIIVFIISFYILIRDYWR